MTAKLFDADAPLDERRIIIRRSGGDVERVELPWGLQPRERGCRPFTVVRAEGRSREYRFALADGDWFYFAGIWRPASREWPESSAILTIEANADVAPYRDRQMAVLRRVDRMRWLDHGYEEKDLLRQLRAGTFRVRHCERQPQGELLH
jgi:putative SOS response-associated peptidase YedK